MDKILKNIACAVEFRNKNQLQVDLGAQFVLLQENKDSLLEAIKHLKECGVDFVSVKPFVLQNANQKYCDNKPLENSEVRELIESSRAFSDGDFQVIFRENAFENSNKERSYTHCLGCNFTAVLNSAGELASCLPYWDKEEFVYGNIYEKTFYEIWNGEKRKKIKQLLENELDCVKCPKNCRPNVINEFLSEILNPSVKHINFI